jgi:hypothetical protein
MRYMMMIRADANSEAGRPPEPKLMAEMTRFVDEMTRAGALLFTGGLAPSSASYRLVAKNGRLSRVDGPFAETKELIGGFAIVDVKTEEEAHAWATRFMKLHQEVLGPTWEGMSEIRPMVDPGITPKARAEE